MTDRTDIESKPFLPYARQSVSEADITSVVDAMKSDFLTRGPKVSAFEQAVASYCGAKHAVAFNSGTTALHAAAWAAEVNANDRYFTTPNTFAATAGAGWHCGAKIFFVDVDPKSGALDLEGLKEPFSKPSTRGRPVIVPVHYAGIPVDMQALDRIISDPNAVVIEDAAAAFGSQYQDGQRIGCCAWSQMTTFSFHPAKHITTAEGGMVTTNDPHLFRRLQHYRNNGIERDPAFMAADVEPWAFEVQEVTGNYNFTEMQAALGLSQLARVEELSDSKRQIVSWYQRELTDLKHLTFLPGLGDPKVVPHLMSVLIDFEALKISRTGLMEALKRQGVGTQVLYIPTYKHPAFIERMGRLDQHFPGAEKFYSQTLSLPLYVGLTDEDVQRVCRALKEQLAEAEVVNAN